MDILNIATAIFGLYIVFNFKKVGRNIINYRKKHNKFLPKENFDNGMVIFTQYLVLVVGVIIFIVSIGSIF